jgi:hypothetical protein
VEQQTLSRVALAAARRVAAVVPDQEYRDKETLVA